MKDIHTIYLPSRPQPDTLVSIFLLREFGSTQFPGIASAAIEIKSSVDPEDTFESLLSKGILPIDVGGGMFDHHGSTFCTTELIARHLSITANPALQKLISYASRDDKEGKGIISKDPIDRALGLSGLIASLNKIHSQEPMKVVNAVMPLLRAHYLAAKEHHIDLPLEVEKKKHEGAYFEVQTTHNAKKITVAFVISDKPSMPTYLRSSQGPQVDVVVQKSEQTNHINILSKQDRRIDFSSVIALIRLRESQLKEVVIPSEIQYLGKTGRIEEVPNWYFDPATISLLNGGTTTSTIAESLIVWEELQKIVLAGLAMDTQIKKQPKHSYYFSIPIPEPIASQMLSNCVSAENIKVHAARNLHLTLAYLGLKSNDEIETIAKEANVLFSTKESFTVRLSGSQLQFGAPEGYSNAWYLALDDQDEPLRELNAALLQACKMPLKDKKFHVTLATKRVDSTPDDAFTFSEPFEYSFDVTSVLLIENALDQGKRTYTTRNTFTLA